MAQEYSIMSYVKLSIIIFLFVVLIGWQYFTYNHRHIVYHWKSLKCSPLYAPLSGFVKGKTGVDAIEDGAENIYKCLGSRIKLFFNQLMEPFHYLLQVIYGVIMGTLQRSNSQRQQLSVVKNYIKKIIEMVMSRLNNISGSFIFVFLKIRDAIKRGLASFHVMAYMLNTSSQLLNSMMSGAVGDMASFAEGIGWFFSWFLLGPYAIVAFPSLWQCTPLCFSPDTKIATRDFGCIPIRQLQVKDYLADGSQVLAIQRCYRPTHTPMYRLGESIVSSSHLVFFKEKNRWIPVDHHPGAELITDADANGISEIYCLTTSTNRIPTDTYQFADWEEYETLEQTVFEKTLIYQDLGCLDFQDWRMALEEQYPPGFSVCPSQYIPSKNKNTTLKGYIQGFSPKPIQWYFFKSLDSTILVSGTTLIKDDKGWIPAYLSKQCALSECEHQHYYHIITSSGIIDIQGVMIRDYLETNNTNTHCEIRNRCLQKMNQTLA